MRSALSFVALLVTIPFLSFGQTPVPLFSDNFDSSSMGSDIVLETNAGDSSVQSGYDYSADSIPAAPNGSGTLGLRTQCNISAGQVEAVNIYLPTAVTTDRFMAQVDIWLNWPVGGSGTTEHAGLGIGGSGAKTNSIYGYGGFPSDTDGLTFGYNSDNDEIDSALWLVLGSPSGQTQVGTWANPTDATPLGQFGTDAPYSAVADVNGRFGNQWITVTITDLGGAITVKMNDTQVVTYFDTTVSGTGHDLIYLVHTDPFASIGTPSDQSFCLFDNLKVFEIPPPLSAKDWTLYQ